MYFGLPVVIALLDNEWVGVYTLMNLGILLSESGLGYFFGARGKATLKNAIFKVLKLPIIYGILAGILYNFLNLALPNVFIHYWEHSIGAWVLLGMMTIGVALSKQKKLEFDIKLLTNMFIPKFVLWPLLGFSIILIDMNFTQAFGREVYIMLAIIVSVPLGGNLASYAATLNLHPERAATAVLISTVMAFITVPAAIIFAQYLLKN